MRKIKNWIKGNPTLKYIYHLFIDLKSFVFDFRHYRKDWSTYRFSIRRTKESLYHPFSLEYYDKLCERVSQVEQAHFISLEQYIDKDHFKDKYNIVMRHDIDSRDCIQKLPFLLEVEKKYGLKSAIYVLTDGVLYHPQEAENLIKDLQAQDYEIGLHTEAHAAQDSRAYMAKEIEAFQRCYGVSPRTYVMHGVIPRPKNYWHHMRKFKKQSSKLEKEFNIKGHLRYGFGEGHFSEQAVIHNGEKRFRLPDCVSDFLKDFYLGSYLMLVTHPWCWKTDNSKEVIA